jgi:anthranilate/para-aminobenzoate synthase component II
MTTTETKMLTLGHVGMGTGVREPFDAIYDNELRVTAEDINNGADIDALVIWGGEDIHPILYNEHPSKFMYVSEGLSRRDIVESEACKAAIERGIPLIGVCRGAQLVCAMAGGRLIQHVEGHGRTHPIRTHDDLMFNTTSVHHQMMFPFDVEHKMLAWAVPKLSNIHINQFGVSDERMEREVEPEIVWFPRIKALAIQGHPEFVRDPDRDPFVQYCLDLIDEYILEGEASNA